MGGGSPKSFLTQITCSYIFNCTVVVSLYKYISFVQPLSCFIHFGSTDSEEEVISVSSNDDSEDLESDLPSGPGTPQSSAFSEDSDSEEDTGVATVEVPSGESQVSAGSEEAMDTNNSESVHPWCLVADNIDKNIRASFQRINYSTLSLHHVNTYAVKDRMNLSNLSDVPMAKQFDITSLLPSTDDSKAINSEFETLVSRFVL